MPQLTGHLGPGDGDDAIHFHIRCRLLNQKKKKTSAKLFCNPYSAKLRQTKNNFISTTKENVKYVSSMYIYIFCLLNKTVVFIFENRLSSSLSSFLPMLDCILIPTHKRAERKKTEFLNMHADSRLESTVKRTSFISYCRCRTIRLILPNLTPSHAQRRLSCWWTSGDACCG